VNEADRARLDLETTEAWQSLPAIVSRLFGLDETLWHRPSGDGIHVQASGHTDPTGDTVVSSAQARAHLARAFRHVLDACASLRGATTALDTAEGSIAGYDGTQQAADMAQHRTACSNCRDHAPTRRGRCSACAQYWAAHHTERPAHLWQRRHHGNGAA